MTNFLQHPDRDTWVNLDLVTDINFVMVDRHMPFAIYFMIGPDENYVGFYFKKDKERLDFMNEHVLKIVKGD